MRAKEDLGMEVMLKLSSKLKEETAPEIVGSKEDRTGASEIEGNIERDDVRRSSSSLPPMNDSSKNTQDDQLKSTRAEMGEVKEENERLKIVLARMVKEYQALQMRLFNVIHHDQNKKISVHHEKEENDLVSLSLGSSSRTQREGQKSAIPREFRESGLMREDLSLSLNSRFDSGGVLAIEPPSNSSSDNAIEEEGVPRPIKSLKMPRSEDDDLAQKTPAKNARVSIRARCDTPTMNDGCQWRKYGQKVAKGNPCPRAYYRCTVAASCPVRKQVQRCAEDMSILITTYEGTHNHPLPAAATAMASSTAAAASMLMAGASVSGPAAGNYSPSGLSDHRQFYLPNPSISSYSSYPTITLDLTSPLSTSPPSSQFEKFSSSLSFSSEPASSSYLNYSSLPYNQQLGFFNHGRQAQETQMQQLFLQRTASSGPLVQTQNPLSSSIAAATKAITSDPSFQSALAVAISSIVGGQGSHGATNSLEQVKPKWTDKQPSRINVNGSGASYFTTPTLNSIHQQAKVVAPKSGSASSIDSGDKMKW